MQEVRFCPPVCRNLLAPYAVVAKRSRLRGMNDTYAHWDDALQSDEIVDINYR
jgi:hypothetical protein